MAILKIRDAEGNMQEILCIRGEDGIDGKDGKDGIDGKDYILTDADKQEIAAIVAGMVAPAAVDIPDTSAFLTEEQVLALIQANMPASAEGVSY